MSWDFYILVEITLCSSPTDVAFVCWGALWDQRGEGESFYDMTVFLFLQDTFPEALFCGDYWMYLALCHFVPALNTSWQLRHEQRSNLIMKKSSAVRCSWSLWGAGSARCHQGWCIPEALAAFPQASCHLNMAKVTSSLPLQKVYSCIVFTLRRTDQDFQKGYFTTASYMKCNCPFWCNFSPKS